MPKKYPKSDAIQNAEPTPPEEAYVFWGDDAKSKVEAQKATAGALDEYTLIDNKATAHSRYRTDFSNLDTNTSGRPGLTRGDYDYFRPDEAIPRQVKNVMYRADDIYQRVGLVKNVIDLMGDFATQGIRIVHRNKRIERFYRRWFEKCNGKDRSERFVNNLYKTGNVVIDRQTGKLTTKASEQMFKALAKADFDIGPDEKVEKRVIPWKYTFLNPLYVDVAAGPLSSFVQNKMYELVLPGNLRKLINAPKNDAEKQIVAQLPDQIIEAAKSKKKYPLDPSRTKVYHYKKDDWQTWAYPMIYAIMDDITVIEKLKLADMSALDGAISNIRIFKLGNLEHKIAPTKAATSKLAQILGNNVGGGTMDLVWGPDIELLESKTNVHQFLGEGKYTPHLNAVYAGLGIPPTLTGTYGAAGTTNNFISLKTLTQRLQYGRDVLVQFWQQEIELVQKAMGFKYPARIEFDRMDLSNEEAEKSLLIQLADRNIVSDEMVRSRFGLDPDMEKLRVNQEHKDHKKKTTPPKVSPYHDANFDSAIKKLGVQLGMLTPSEVGVELNNKDSDQQNLLELKDKFEKPKKPAVTEKTPGQPGEGRPMNSKDEEKRKEKEFAPQTGASLSIWAINAQETISEIVNPIMLDFYGKKNLRSLSHMEASELEEVKSKILFNIKPYSVIDRDSVELVFNSINTNANLELMGHYINWQKSIQQDLPHTMSLDDQKQAKASFYSMVYTILHKP
tara:strand:- start:4726 stop:6915 length:2190 start_codon:yes stop_codon:yes gene_type:complete